jgi:transposase-like protein
LKQRQPVPVLLDEHNGIIAGHGLALQANNLGLAEEPKRVIDWEAIEREYRAGQLSVSEIARLHGVSHPLIFRKAKREGWTRNLAERVKEAVTARLVTDGVTAGVTVTAGGQREVIALAAERAVQVVRQHRQDIGHGLRIVRTLFMELDEASENLEEIEAEIGKETAKDKTSQRRAAMLRAVALPSRSAVVGNLSSALKTLVGLERQAFNLETEAPTVEGAIDRIVREVVYPKH